MSIFFIFKKLNVYKQTVVCRPNNTLTIKWVNQTDVSLQGIPADDSSTDAQKGKENPCRN